MKRKISKILAIVEIILSLIFIIIYVLQKNGVMNYSSEVDNILLIFLILMDAIMIFNLLYSLYTIKKDIDSRHVYRNYLINKLEYNESQSINSDAFQLEKSQKKNSKTKPVSNDCNNLIDEQKKNDEKKDIFALMLKNNDEITDYFKISKSQAKASFWFSVISCFLGAIALAIGIYSIAVLKDISISIISLISGSISELISGTVFWVHNKSALQLNHYYDALHENEKILSAINIADKLSDEKREKALIEIIHKLIDNRSYNIETESDYEE